MSTLTLGIIVIIYMFVIAWLGYLGYRQTKNASDYLLGGRKVNPIIMALSYGATFISASAIVGFGGVAATFGMGIQWLCLLNMFMGVVVAFIFFGRRTRKLGEAHNARTFPQLLGLHYKSRSIQIFIASIIFIGMPLYAAVVMKGGAVFIEQMFHIDLHLALLIFTLIVAAYVITGGIKGVLYTDALQAVIMFACMLFLLFWFYHIMDMGFIEVNQKLTDIAPMVPERFKALGHQGWTAMPISGSPQWYTLVTSLILGVGIGCLAQPQLVVRFMMVESTKQLNRGVLIGCVFLIVTVGAIYHVGALSNLFFLKTEGVVASEAVKDMDKIIPLFINKAMPEWFGAEGDWKTAALYRTTWFMSQGLPKGCSFLEDYTLHFDGEKSAILQAHMLEVCPLIAEQKPRLEVHRLSIGIDSETARLVFTSKQGEGVAATVVDLGNRFRLIVNVVDCIKSKKLPKLPVASALWIPQPNLEVGAGAWILAGGTHHTSFSYDLTTEYWEDYAEIAGIEMVVIDKNTTIPEFKKELRMNEVYYMLNKALC